MRSIDWMYHRKGCKTCQRAQDFLTEHKVKQPDFVDARKATLSKKDALRIAREAHEILAGGSDASHTDAGNGELVADAVFGLVGRLG